MKKIILGIFIFLLIILQKFFFSYFLLLNLFFLFFFVLHFLEVKKEFIFLSIFEGGILLDLFSTSFLGSHLFSLLGISFLLEKIFKKINKENIFSLLIIFLPIYFVYLSFINLFDFLFSFGLSSFNFPSLKDFLVNFLICFLSFPLIKKYEKHIH